MIHKWDDSKGGKKSYEIGWAIRGISEFQARSTPLTGYNCGWAATKPDLNTHKNFMHRLWQVVSWTRLAPKSTLLLILSRRVGTALQFLLLPSSSSCCLIWCKLLQTEQARLLLTIRIIPSRCGWSSYRGPQGHAGGRAGCPHMAWVGGVVFSNASHLELPRSSVHFLLLSPLPRHVLSHGFPLVLQQLWEAAEVNITLQESCKELFVLFM